MLPKKILVPVDFSDSSNTALDYAISLAQSTEATVTAMHAFMLPIIGFPDGALVASAEIAAKMVNGAQADLDALVASRKKSGVTLEKVLKQADPRDAILSVGKEIGADLVVMGTHGRRGIMRALIGSVAESVVRTSPIPVLTLRTPNA